MRTRIGVYGVATDADEVLLTRLAARERDAGRWTLPGGGLDFGETPREALRREFGEETGLVPAIGDPLDVISFTPRPDFQVIQIVFLVTASGIPQVMEVDGSTVDVAWVPRHDISAIATVSLVDHVADLLGW